MPYLYGGYGMSSKMRSSKIIKILEREGDLTGGRLKEILDAELVWGAGSINSVVMLCRKNKQIEQKGFIAWPKNARQIVWGLKE